MGTLNWSMAPYGSNPGKSVIASEVTASGTFTTTTTGANITGLAAQVSQVLRVHADEAMRISFGGTTATATVGHYVPAGATADFEIEPGHDGNVSAADVA